MEIKALNKFLLEKTWKRVSLGKVLARGRLKSEACMSNCPLTGGLLVDFLLLLFCLKL